MSTQEAPLPQKKDFEMPEKFKAQRECHTLPKYKKRIIIVVPALLSILNNT